MSEFTLHIQIPVLLPCIEDEHDPCVERLREHLAHHRGIQQVHVERQDEQALLCLHYDPNLLSLARVQHLAERAGASITNRYHHALIAIEGMDCSDCAMVIEHSVGRLEGVLSVSVNYAAEHMRVEFDALKTDQAAVERHVRSLGYAIPINGLQRQYLENRELVFSLFSGLLLLAGWAGGRWLGFHAPVSLTLYLAAYVLGGWDISRYAFHALRERRFDTDLLMVLAALGAALLGDFAEGALLLFLFSLGHALEERALDRARAAIRALSDLAPKTALVRRAGQGTELPVEQLRLGDVVVVRPGVRVPVDGDILAGESGVDQSPVTGESVPVDKTPGDKVFAGSVNGEGALQVRVTRLARDSTLARVMEMVEEAQAQKSPTQQLTERFQRVFVPAVLMADVLLMFVLPLLGVPFQEAFLRAMTLLVAASPCALALGTPASILAGVAQAARYGVLVKGGAHLENLGRLQAIAFDKTGTITKGQPEVTDVITPRNAALSAGPLLALAAVVESRSGHPLAQAVVRAARSQGLPFPAVGNIESLTGRGLRSSLDGQTVLIGSLKLMDESAVTFSDEMRRHIDTLEASGKTTMAVALGSQIVGVLALADTLRANVAQTMAALNKAGVRETVLLTGDNARIAATIAGQAGLSNFRADLMPEDKVSAIRRLVAEYGHVAMVGDGVNDAPALANATVGIAMGGAGTDVALETADVALMSDDLSRLPFAVELGRATRAVIAQNLTIAMGVIVLLAIASLLGLAGIGIAIFLHEGSTIVVVLNALRLLGFRAAQR